MKLKLTPQELLESFKLLTDKQKSEFIMLVMQHMDDFIDDDIGMESPAGDRLRWGEHPLDTLAELVPMEGVQCIVTNPDKPAKLLTVRVELQNVQPPIWREIQLPSNLVLESFAHVILMAMGWGMEHLHQFVKGGKYYSVPSDFNSDMMGNANHADSLLYTVGDLIIKKGNKCTFEYDFGDGWEHSVSVTSARDYKQGENRTLVSVTGGARACPPENVGGPLGYEEYLEALADPESDEALDTIEWYGEIDPEEFCLEDFDEEIKSIPGNGDQPQPGAWY
ncbi:MAG: plasmid pRiA4b ORF-3 family protein [Bacteroidales bacterium]|nr:plasmid pRiA4b ORF-3 family protein [Bacteroidales bacterium]